MVPNANLYPTGRDSSVPELPFRYRLSSKRKSNSTVCYRKLDHLKTDVMSTTENYRYKNLVELVKDANRFQIRGTEWRFCLKDPTDPASPWKAFGVVLEENVKWLKKANSKWLEFDWMSKQIRLINPPTDPTTATIQLNVAWKEIIDKLDEIQGCNLPQWVKKDTKWLYNDKESWPLIDEDENFRKLFRQGICCDLVPIFGIVTTGAHLNVYKLTEEKGYEIWVSRRPDTQPNFPGLLDQAAAGGFTPSRRTILECIEKEKKEESKGYPQNWRELMHRSPDIPTIQFLDLRDWRWGKGLCWSA